VRFSFTVRELLGQRFPGTRVKGERLRGEREELLLLLARCLQFYCHVTPDKDVFRKVAFHVIATIAGNNVQKSLRSRGNHFLAIAAII